MTAEPKRPDADPTLKAVLGAYTAHLKAERRASPYTVRNYTAAATRFAGFLGAGVRAHDLARLQTKDFRAYLSARRADGLGPESLSLELSALKSLFSFLRARYAVENDAVAAMRGPRLKQKLPRPVAKEDAARLIEMAGEGDAPAWVRARDQALFTLIYGAGLRVSEALSLKRTDAPFGETLRIRGKGGKERLAPVLPAVREAVRGYLDICPYDPGPDGALFLGRRGGAMGARAVQKEMKRLGAALGLPASATPHALRHAFATYLLVNGGDLRAVQELLGHASIAATQRYTRVDPRELVAAYEKAHPRAE